MTTAEELQILRDYATRVQQAVDELNIAISDAVNSGLVVIEPEWEYIRSMGMKYDVPQLFIATYLSLP